MAVAESTGSAPGDIETRGINVVRGLAMDAVQKANSGHPGRRWRSRRSPTCCSRGS